MYADVSVVVDGALQEEHTFTDDALMVDYIRQIEDDALGHGYLTEVFVIEHDHDPLTGDEECACVQYLTDHKPAYVFNGPQS